MTFDGAPTAERPNPVDTGMYILMFLPCIYACCGGEARFNIQRCFPGPDFSESPQQFPRSFLSELEDSPTSTGHNAWSTAPTTATSPATRATDSVTPMKLLQSPGYGHLYPTGSYEYSSPSPVKTSPNFPRTNNTLSRKRLHSSVPPIIHTPSGSPLMSSILHQTTSVLEDETSDLGVAPLTMSSELNSNLLYDEISGSHEQGNGDLSIFDRDTQPISDDMSEFSDSQDEWHEATNNNATSHADGSSPTPSQAAVSRVGGSSPTPSQAAVSRVGGSSPNPSQAGGHSPSSSRVSSPSLSPTGNSAASPVGGSSPILTPAGDLDAISSWAPSPMSSYTADNDRGVHYEPSYTSSDEESNGSSPENGNDLDFPPDQESSGSSPENGNDLDFPSDQESGGSSPESDNDPDFPSNESSEHSSSEEDDGGNPDSELLENRLKGDGNEEDPSANFDDESGRSNNLRTQPTRNRNELNKPTHYLPIPIPYADNICKQDEGRWTRNLAPWDTTRTIPFAEDNRGPVGLNYPPFIGQPGRQIDPLTYDPIGFFDLMFERNMWGQMARSTDARIRWKISMQEEKNGGELPKFSPYRDHTVVTESEIQMVIAYLIAMALIRKPELEQYWSMNPVMRTPFFGERLSRARFQRIYWNLHCNRENTPSDNRPATTAPANRDPTRDDLKRVRPFVDMVNRCFGAAYKPHRELSYDELTWSWTGRWFAKKYNSNKPHREHFFAYACCDAHIGYLLGFDVYFGKTHKNMRQVKLQTRDDASSVDSCALAKQVLWHLDKLGFLDKGHHVYTDNFYTSLTLIRELKLRDTLMCGTIKLGDPMKGKLDNPNKLPWAFAFVRKERNEKGTEKAIKLEKGEVIFRRSIDNEILTVKFEDRKCVHLATNIHRAELAQLPTVIDFRNRRVTKKKPTCILDYNKFMGGVDRAGQLAGSYSRSRLTHKWPFKMLIHMLDAVIVNAYILYRDHKRQVNEAPISHWKFCLSLAEALVERAEFNATCGLYSIRPQRAPLPVTELARLGGRHFLEHTPNSEKRKHVPKPCVVCKAAGVQSKRTSFQCKTCKVPLCPTDCNEIYHTKEDYKSYAGQMRNRGQAESNVVPDIDPIEN